MFEGEKVKLTGMAREDLNHYRKWNGESAFGRFYNASPIFEMHEKKANDWFEEQSDRNYRFSIRTMEDNQFVGVCAIEDIIWPHGVGWLSIALGPDYQGRGFGKEAMQLLLRYGFNELNLYRIQLTVFDYNSNAIQLYEKLGFQKEGTMRQFLRRDGKRYDMHHYGLLEEEWRGMELK